jgi:hypothetical protein
MEVVRTPALFLAYQDFVMTPSAKYLTLSPYQLHELIMVSLYQGAQQA